MPPGDLTNSFLARLMSIDFLAMLFIGAIAWGVLSEKVEGLEESQQESKAQILQSIKQTADINVMLGAMTANQENFKYQIQQVDKKLNAIQSAVMQKDNGNYEPRR
jgi:hypothetical protein